VRARALENEARTVRLDLRRDVTFSDGSPLTTATAKASLERSIRLATDSMPPAFESILGVSSSSRARRGRRRHRRHVRTQLQIRLHDPLPIFPSLLTDGRTAIVGVASDGAAAIGTGRSSASSHARPGDPAAQRKYWRAPPASIASSSAPRSRPPRSSRTRAGSTSSATCCLRTSTIVRDARFRGGPIRREEELLLRHVPRGEPGGISPRCRARRRDAQPEFVWGALGRFAMPATGVIPPGVLGHDPGRRQHHCPARGDRADPGVRAPHAGAPPRGGAPPPGTSTRAHRAAAPVGGPGSSRVATRTMRSTGAGARRDRPDPGRWIADYDNFTFGLVHSARASCAPSSPRPRRTDPRGAQRGRPAVRGPIPEVQHDLLERDPRAAVSRRGLHRGSACGAWLRTAPYVNYSESARPASAGRQPPTAGGGFSTCRSRAASVARAEPHRHARTDRMHDQHLPDPDLGAGQVAGDAVARLRVLVGNGAAHPFPAQARRPFDGRADGPRRPLLVRTDPGESEQQPAGAARPDPGATAVLEGKRADLEGFHIVSPLEFSSTCGRSRSLRQSCRIRRWRSSEDRRLRNELEGRAIRHGPFRVISFEPGRRLELERNPYYWREGYPRSEGIVFQFGVSPEEIRNEFLAGRFSLASDLLPADAEAFRHDSRFASGYRESPHLQTYFVAFNRHRGPLRDADLRRARSGRRRLGPGAPRPLAIPAHGLLPPGLLGLRGGLIFRGRVTRGDSGLVETVGDMQELTAPSTRSSPSSRRSRAHRGLPGDRDPGPARRLFVAETSVREGRGRHGRRALAGRLPDADTFVQVLHSETGLGPLLPTRSRRPRRRRAETSRAALVYRRGADRARRAAAASSTTRSLLHAPEVQGLAARLGARDSVRLDLDQPVE
jgi:hypothetical protein